MTMKQPVRPTPALRGQSTCSEMTQSPTDVTRALRVLKRSPGHRAHKRGVKAAPYEWSSKQEVTGGVRERITGECERLLSLSPVPLSLLEWKGRGVTLPIPVVAGSPSTRERQMCLTGRRETAHVCVKSEDMKSRLGPNTSEVCNFQPACPLIWVTVSSPIK